jgi:hypothetical protein
VASLKNYLDQHGGKKRRPAKAIPCNQPLREEAGDVRVMRSPEIDTASVTFPARIDLETRAARMNEFWRKLVEFQYQDVLVVALCSRKK